MARITVEDCLHRIENRFELVLMASRRARQLEHGAVPTVPADDDKPAVIALREIADNTIDVATIDAIDQERREREAREAIEWAAADWRNDDESDDDGSASLHTVTDAQSARATVAANDRTMLEDSRDSSTVDRTPAVAPPPTPEQAPRASSRAA